MKKHYAWVPSDLDKLIAVLRGGATVIPADRAPFEVDDAGKQPLVSLFVGGRRVSGEDVALELAGVPSTMGQLAGRMRGAAEAIGPEAAAGFAAAFDQAMTFQRDT